MFQCHSPLYIIPNKFFYFKYQQMFQRLMPSWFDHPLSWNVSYCHLLQHCPINSQYMISSRQVDCRIHKYIQATASSSVHTMSSAYQTHLSPHCRNVTHLMVQLVLPAAFARLSHVDVSSSLWLSVELCTLCSARARELFSGGPRHGP